MWNPPPPARFKPAGLLFHRSGLVNGRLVPLERATKLCVAPKSITVARPDSVLLLELPLGGIATIQPSGLQPQDASKGRTPIRLMTKL